MTEDRAAGAYFSVSTSCTATPHCINVHAPLAIVLSTLTLWIALCTGTSFRRTESQPGAQRTQHCSDSTFTPRLAVSANAMASGWRATRNRPALVPASASRAETPRPPPRRPSLTSAPARPCVLEDAPLGLPMVRSCDAASEQGSWAQAGG